MADARSQAPYLGDAVPELPGYRIEGQLGRGSAGVVYLAEDVQLRRKVALKILAPTLADDELFRKRFDRESQSAANLDHPNIVPVYAAGEAGGSLYIAMRYVGGGDLRALLDANGPLSLEQAAAIVISVADALDFAHSQGMVHRDVKPANILIDGRNGQEHYYLSDFGIIKIIASDRSLSSAGQIVGTIDYIAPEQLQGKALDGRADLYALGCVLYQCLTGVVPFPRDETAALMWAQVHDEAAPVTTRRPDLPPQIDSIVAKAMAKQPEDRYGSCRELAIAVRLLVADSAASGGSAKIWPARPSSSPAPPPVPSGMTSTYTPPTAAPVRTPAASSPRRWRWWWFAAAGMLTLALIGGSTVGVMKYLSSQFPNPAEQELLKQVPLALQKSCDRNPEVEPEAVSIQASVICKSDGDAPNTTVFTQFKSSQALDSHYQTAVAAVPVGPNAGDCLNTETAEGAYQSQTSRMSGRTVCYQQLRSSFVAWTDDQAHILVEATRVDPDYLKLRDWWAGVVGLPTRAQLEAQAQAKKQIEDADKKAAEAQARAEKAEKQAEQERQQRALADQKRADDDTKKAELQASEAHKKQLEDDKAKAEALTKQAAEEKAKAEALMKQAAEEKAKAEALQKQPLGGSRGGQLGENGGQLGQIPDAQQPNVPGAVPNNPTENLTVPPSLDTPKQPSTSSLTLNGPAPAAPGPRQGASPVAGSGGCTSTGVGYYACTLAQPAPGYLPGSTQHSAVLRGKQSAYLCQSDGSTYSVGNRTNHWWAWADAGQVGVWVPTVFLEGGTDNGPVPGLPVCGSASSSANTRELPRQSGPLIGGTSPDPFPGGSTKRNEDNPPSFKFPF